MSATRSVSLKDRSAGVLLHVTSLPGGPFTGDLGAGAGTFLDWLQAARQHWWQMLPVNPIGDGDSPYSTVSSFAGEPLLIGLEPLVHAGWLTRKDLPREVRGASGPANYRASRRVREPLLRRAFEKARGKLKNDARLAAFRARERFWLKDYTLFMALADEFNQRDWCRWPASLKRRDKTALVAATSALEEEIHYLEFLQFAFQLQWTELHDRARRGRIGLIGDLPIFVSHGSADVWAHPEQFLLAADGRPTFVAGCPPDAFNKDGQLWGNALYDWRAVKASGYEWWIQRIGRMFRLFDAVRLDHFIGFYNYWEIQAQAKNARGGKWRRADGDGAFTAATRRLGPLEVIAEDLGAVVPAVRSLRDKFAFPGMKVLQFAFDGTPESWHHKAHLVPERSVVYTGTHDNPTTLGWIRDLKHRSRRDPKAKREYDDVLAYLGGTENQVADRLIRAAFGTKANVAVLPLQDLLGLGAPGRMNVPGVGMGNWRYRATAKNLSREKAQELASLTRLYDRIVP